jgi:hypothetical protein
VDKPQPHHPFNGRNAGQIPRNLRPPGYRRRKRVTTSGSGPNQPCLQRSSTSHPDKNSGTNLYSSARARACKARLQW